jgi:hypothetical protein
MRYFIGVSPQVLPSGVLERPAGKGGGPPTCWVRTLALAHDKGQQAIDATKLNQIDGSLSRLNHSIILLADRHEGQVQ